MTMETELNVINDYLARLDRAAQALPVDRRTELLAGIREHIDSARAGDQSAGAVEGEAATRALLDRLGSPEEIVAAAAEGLEPGPGPQTPLRPPGVGFSAPARRGMALETGAVLLMTAGSVLLPVIGWLIGVVLMWSSDRWTVKEKLTGTFVIPGGLGVFVLVGLFGVASSCSETTSGSAGGPTVTSGTCDGGSSWTDHLVAPILIVVAVAALAVPFYLLHRARVRASQERAADQLY